MEIMLVAGTIMIMVNTMVLLLLAPTIIREVRHDASRKF
jgi:hypothetical protein